MFSSCHAVMSMSLFAQTDALLFTEKIISTWKGLQQRLFLSNRFLGSLFSPHMYFLFALKNSSAGCIELQARAKINVVVVNCSFKLSTFTLRFITVSCQWAENMKVVFNMRTFGADLEMCLFQRDSPSSPGFRECHKLPTLTRSVRGGLFLFLSRPQNRVYYIRPLVWT